MRLRSPAAIASTLVVACAVALVGVALAAGGGVREQRPWLDAAGVGQRQLLERGKLERLRAGRAARARLRLARARPLTRPAPSPIATATPGEAVIEVPIAQAPAGGAAPVEPAHPVSPEPPAVEPQPEAPAQPQPDPPAQPPEPKAPEPQPAPEQPEPTAPTPEPAPETASPARAAALYWGASIGNQLTGEQAPWDMGAVREFEQIAGKQVSLVNFFSPFANCPTAGDGCSFYKFPTGPMESIRKYGAIPVFSWSSQSIPSRTSEPDFQLADVIAGSYDSYIREFAEDARDWGHPFFLRFDWEMNGSWFPWGEGANGNRPGEFVAAWRHVHDIFAAVGADQVTWVWCPNVDPEGIFADLASLYPGDAYVDWTGLDGYNWGLNPAKPDRWRSFDELYSATYARVAERLAPDKPLLIGEIGSTEQGGSKAAWIEEALSAIPSKYPKIGGLLWFDTYDDGMDWPIETSASAAGAFAAGIQSPVYVEGAVSTTDGPIPPPS
ncbi:MAG TPA: glycosyl hydrolase [Solirubrobacterales bacterium]|nr:glycosyl hydrolase [Solirubrobacterales bacterium]